MLPTPSKPSSRRARAASSARFTCGRCGNHSPTASPRLDFPLDNNRYNDYAQTMNLRSKSSSPGVYLENRIFVAVLQTADTLGQEAEQLLKAAGIPSAQYNVPRISRGAEPERLACRGLREPIIFYQSHATRLFDSTGKHGP